MKETFNFLIQKHNTPHPHYDLYLEVGDELKSWIIPNGIPTIKKEKKVAVENEILDEPIDNIESQYLRTLTGLEKQSSGTREHILLKPIRK